jgi:hypothetical protein
MVRFLQSDLRTRRLMLGEPSSTIVNVRVRSFGPSAYRLITLRPAMYIPDSYRAPNPEAALEIIAANPRAVLGWSCRRSLVQHRRKRVTAGSTAGGRLIEPCGRLVHQPGRTGSSRFKPVSGTPQLLGPSPRLVLEGEVEITPARDRRRTCRHWVEVWTSSVAGTSPAFRPARPLSILFRSRRRTGPKFSVPLEEVLAIEAYTRWGAGTVRVITPYASLTIDQILGRLGEMLADDAQATIPANRPGPAAAIGRAPAHCVAPARPAPLSWRSASLRSGATSSDRSGRER